MDKQVARTHLILLLVWMTSIEIESYLCHTHKVKELEGLFFCFLEGGGTHVIRYICERLGIKNHYH